MQESGALIEITTDVRESVRRAADAGLRAAPARIETGGILTSTVSDGHLVINGAEPIRCEHKYGPAYHLSPEECDHMRAAAEAIRSSRTRQIAGYFRSCVGDRFRLFPDDEIIVREVLPEAQFILLAKPLAAGVSMARLFERDAAGSWSEAAQFEMVPGAPRALASTRRRSGESDPRPVKWLPIAGGLAIVIVLLLAWVQSSNRRPAAVRNTSPLGMRISTQGDSFWLSWDRNSAAVKQATGGVLRILDGGGHRDIVLDASQVQNGSVLYRPQSGDVSFNLELRSDAGSLGAESIRALDGSRTIVTSSTSAPPASAPVQPAPTGTTFRRTRPPASAVQPTQPEMASEHPISSEPAQGSGEPAAASKPPITVIANEAAPPPLVIPPGPLVLDPPRTTPISIPAATAPPPSAARTEVATAASKDQPLNLKQEPAPKEAPKVVAAVTQPSKGAPAVVVPAASAPVPPLVRAPQPLRKVLPNIRSLGPQVLFETTSVDVQVSIDTAGRVTEAHALNTGKKINQALVSEAVKAAEQWTFEPATNRGKPVPANHVITFRFNRGS